MVDRTKLFDTVSRHISLFEEIVSKSEIIGDRNRAEYGLKEAKEIQISLDANPALSNKNLMKIYSLLTNITRGVEYFEEYEMEKKKRELDKEIYFIKKDLEKYIKW